MKRDLTRGSIPKLIKQIAVPASIGMIFSTMYNLVDTWFAGLLSTQALAALGLSFPVFFCIIALGSGIATGATALIANSLGEKRKDMAKLYATQAVTFGLLLSVLLTALGFYLAPVLFRILGAEGEYLSIALSYMNVILAGTVFFMMTFILNSILNAHGDTRTFRNVLITGFFLNLILNPSFMYGWWLFPKMGIAGIGLATVVIQLLSTAYMTFKVSRIGIFCRRCLSMALPRKEPFKEISKQGFPASLNMMTIALGIFIITYFVSDFGKDAVAAYGVVQRIEQMAMLPLMGLNVAVLSIVGQNNGAKNYDRIKTAIWTALRYGVAVVAVGAVTVFTIPGWLMSLFTKEANVIAIGVSYLRVAAFIMWGYIILYLIVAALQGMKRPLFAIWIGLYRQIAGAYIVFYIAKDILDLGIVGIWWGIFFT